MEAYQGIAWHSIEDHVEAYQGKDHAIRSLERPRSVKDRATRFQQKVSDELVISKQLLYLYDEQFAFRLDWESYSVFERIICCDGRTQF